MSKLPLGWSVAQIGSLCTLENGRAFKPSEWTTEGLPIVRIQNLNNPEATFNYFNGEFSERYRLCGGELLFAWSGTPGTSFGAHVWRGGEAVLNQHIFRVDFNEAAIDKRFFRFAINQKLNELIDIAHGGVGLRHVTKSKFESTEISLAPFNEQKRIADKLDAILARVDARRQRLDRIPAILKRFRQAVLAAAISGKLTEDWRIDRIGRLELKKKLVNEINDAAHPNYDIFSDSDLISIDLSYKISEPPSQVEELPEDWQWIKVGELAKKVTDGVHKKPNYVATGIPFLTVKNMTAGPGLDFSNTNFVTEIDHEEFCKRTYPERGDILVSKDGTLGVVRLIDTERIFSIFVSVALIKLRDKRMSKYMCIALESPILQKQMVGVGTGLQHIHLRDLREDLVPVPPLEEQAEIVRRVEALFAYASRLEARYTAARAQVEKLTPALLAKAFRGELVPQDPSDEPASILLERIRLTRAENAAKPQRPRRKAHAQNAVFASGSPSGQVGVPGESL